MHTLFPKHIQIETINGVCTAKCIMCTINNWKRPVEIMPFNVFKLILEKLQNLPNQEFVTLHGLGEPLLDKEIAAKIAIAKKLNFKGVGFASNCTELKPEISRQLLDSGLDTIICSVDGFNKETHESIRRGTNFTEIVSNIKNFISLRNQGGYKTRVLLRFIRQIKNYKETDDYKRYWLQLLDTSKNDCVLVFDVHNWGGEANIDNQVVTSRKDKLFQKNEAYCPDLVERLMIASDGTLRLCCADDNIFYKLGSAIDDDPIALWNGEKFREYRKAMSNNKLMDMPHCRTCSIIKSRMCKESYDDLNAY